MSAPIQRFSRFLLYTLLLGFGAGLAACGDDGSGPGGNVEVTVMTRNLYLGGNIFRLAEAQSLQQIPPLVGELYGNVVGTNFPARAGALAAEIARTNPALVGLQEVEVYRVQAQSDFQSNPLPNAQTVTFDFLQILRDSLTARGASYVVAGQVQNADAELPAVLDRNNPTLSDVRLTDYDVVLARSDVRISGVVAKNYIASAQLSSGGFAVPFPRGYVKVNAVVDGAEFTFVNTHLEGLVPAHESQAKELLEAVNGFRTPVILVGDLNTRADGTGTPGYGILVSNGPFKDAFSTVSSAPGLTCCFTADLKDPAAALFERIDLVLFRGNVTPLSAEVVGDEAADRTASGLWPSDHAGVVVTFRVPK